MTDTVRASCFVLRAPLLVLLLAACGGDDAPSAVGTLEVTAVDLAPMVSARVVRMLVEEGDLVHAGDTVAVLTQAGLHDQVAEAAALLSAAEQRSLELERGSRPEEITKAEQDLASAAALADQLVVDRDRARTLAATQVISRQQLEQAEARAQEAEARRNATAEQLTLVRDGARAEVRAAARAEAAKARATLARVQATVVDLVLVTPIEGTVLVRSAEPNEVLPAGVPAITVGDATLPWVRVYVGQSVLPLLQVGDSATALFDDFPDHPFHGRIVSINTRAEYTPRVALTERERADLLFGVKIQFVDSTRMLKPGVPVTVTFRVGS